MTTIGRLNYQIAGDANSFTAAAVASRAELRELKKNFVGTRTDAELFAVGVARIDDQLKRGVISQEFYDRQLKELRQTLPEVREEQERLNKAIKDAESISKAAASPLTNYRQRMSELDDHLARGRITHQEYAFAVQREREAFVGALPVLGQYVGALTPIGAAALIVSAGVAAAAAATTLLASAFIGINRHAITTLQSLDGIADQAKLLGISAAELSDLSFIGDLSDVSTDTVTAGLQKMLVSLSEASHGNKELADTFQALGIDAATAMANPIDALRHITSAISALPSQAQRLEIIRHVFGRGNAEIVNLVESMAQSEAKLAELKNGFGSVNWGAVDEFDSAWKEVKITLELISRNVASDLAPHLTEAVRAVLELLRDDTTKRGLLTIVDLTKFGIDTIKEAAKQAAAWVEFLLQPSVIENIIAFLTPSNPTLALALKAAKGEAESLLATYRELRESEEKLGRMKQKNAPVADVDKIKEFAKGATENEAAEKKLRSTIDSVMDGIENQITAMRAGADAAEYVRLAVAGATDADLEYLQTLQHTRRELEIVTSVQKLSDSLRDQILTWDMSADAIERYKLGMAGATDEQLKMIEQQQQWLAELKEQKELTKEAEQVINSLKTPWQKFLDEEEKLTKLFDAGKLPLEAYEAAIKKARKEANKAIEAKFDFVGIPAALKGSQEAIAAVAKYRAELERKPDVMKPAIIGEELKNLEAGELTLAGPDVPSLQALEVPDVRVDTTSQDGEAAELLERAVEVLEGIRDEVKKDPIEFDHVEAF